MTNTSPDEMRSVASAIAMQLLGMPESQKVEELGRLRQQNPTLTALVADILNNMKLRGDKDDNE